MKRLVFGTEFGVFGDDGTSLVGVFEVDFVGEAKGALGDVLDGARTKLLMDDAIAGREAFSFGGFEVGCVLDGREVLEEFGGDFFEEAGADHGARCAPHETVGGGSEVEVAHGASHADIAEAPFFFERFCGAF